jgi:polysaccharide biosynthesis/export protein
MNRCYRILLLAIVFGVSLQVIAQEQTPQGTSQEEQPQPEPKKPLVPPPITDPTYIIGPQDALNISVWKEPDLSGNVQVRPDGKVSVPLLNDVQAAGLTAIQLSTQITKDLKKYVADPHVTVVVTEVKSRRVYVLGEVFHPGGFALLPDMTVLQAISDAGGLTQFAHGKKIYVLRNEGGQQVKYPFNYNKVLKAENPEQNFPLKSGDTIVVP